MWERGTTTLNHTRISVVFYSMILFIEIGAMLWGIRLVMFDATEPVSRLFGFATIVIAVYAIQAVWRWISEAIQRYAVDNAVDIVKDLQLSDYQ